MLSPRCLPVILFLVGIVTCNVPKVDQDGRLLCQPRDPICEKFRHMLVQHNAEDGSNLRSSDQDGEELLCDKTDPICQKFQQMLAQNEEEGAANTRAGDDTQPPPLSCDPRDPICQKFQNMLQIQETRIAGANGTDPATSGPSMPCNKWWCETVLKRRCYANGTCGELVNEEST